MEQETCNGINWNDHSTKLWVGIAAGVAIGLGIALSRRQKKSRWDSARQIGNRITDRSGELTDAAGDIIGRLKVIYDEGRKLAEDAGALWAHGRKVAGY
jgi:hypothetical protein